MLKQQKFISILLPLLLMPVLSFGRAVTSGYCEQGGKVVVTSSVQSTTRVQQSYPQCTIAVYQSATSPLRLATLYSDNFGTPKANPFTASTTGYWTYYADDGVYDIQLSGGGIPSPYTRPAVNSIDQPSLPPKAAVYTTQTNFSQPPGGTYTPGNSIQLTPCPLGVNGTDAHHYVYLSGGSGTPEAALISGGTCTSGAAGGTILVGAANSHSGAWTVSSATAGIQEAVVVATATGGGRNVYFFGTSDVSPIHAPVFIYTNMTGGIIAGASLGQAIQAASDFVGPSMFKGDTNLGVFTLRDLLLDVNNVAAVITVIDLSITENAIRNTVQRIRVEAVAANSTILNMDGGEDSVVDNCSFYATIPSTGVVAIAWHVPFGNLHIHDSSMVTPLYLSYQIADIRASTIGTIVADGFGEELDAIGLYIYPAPSLKAHFYANGPSSVFNSIRATAYLVPEYVGNITSGIVSFRGNFAHKIDFWGYIYNIPSALSSATTAYPNSFPVFEFHGEPIIISGAIGTPAAPIAVILDSQRDVATGASTSFGVPLSFSLATTSLTLANGNNNNIPIGIYRYIRSTAPTADYALTGFEAPVAGLGGAGAAGAQLYFLNTTAHTVTIRNNSSLSSPANRIFTLTGADVTLAPGAPSIAEFIYDGSDWALLSTYPATTPSNFLTTDTGQTVTGVKTFDSNILFGTDNLYNFASLTAQPSVVYSRVLHSQLLEIPYVFGSTDSGFHMSMSMSTASQFSLKEPAGVDVLGFTKFGADNYQWVLTGSLYPGGTLAADRVLGAAGASWSSLALDPTITFTGAGTCNSGKKGTISWIADSSTVTWGANIAGSGGNLVLAACNGANWTVIGK